MSVANTCVDWFVRNLYDRGEGVRYAVEQTGGYTIPRIVQQWNRTRSLTGEGNPMAAMEMGIREFAADFADTFLPGLLATPVIGFLIDKAYKTMVQKNMGSSALLFYEALMHRPDGSGYRSQNEFFDAVGQTLTHHARHINHDNPHIGVLSDAQFSLAAHMQAIADAKDSKKALSLAEEQIVTDLKLPHPDVTLSYGKQTLTLPLSHLLEDLGHLKNAAAVQSPHLIAQPAWGQHMAETLAKTRRLMPHQMWGIAVALAVSTSIPFAVRLITRWYYGEDAFPGTKELHTHFAKDGAAPVKKTPEKFVLFPYLSECAQKGQWTPLVQTAGFFAFLGAMILRRFHAQGLSPLKMSHWLKVYEFDRGAPISTLAQMEMTYGLLCGMRLASSRDDSEFRETGLRDCLLGWPTLTYGFAALKKGMSLFANRRLEKTFHNASLLLKNGKEVRTGEEIAPHFFNNLAIRGDRQAALEQSRLAHRWITFMSALTNWGLLAFIEPQLGIWITNQLEMKKIQEKNETPLPLKAPISQAVASVESTLKTTDSRPAVSVIPVFQLPASPSSASPSVVTSLNAIPSAPILPTLPTKPASVQPLPSLAPLPGLAIKPLQLPQSSSPVVANAS